ncbi:DUF4192 domain-containing protein [Mycobacterium sp. AMU20-3851]|uniref:DUF4192 domain-containing protein n=1 Tax=Mycobacterium sp. AMU20-3851 TaxID=3122055 RepID=UPI00375467B5
MTTQPRGLDIGRPASLIAALPAVLGFVPEHSLAVVTLDSLGSGAELGAVMRVDLSAGLAENTDHLAEVVGASAPEGAIAVIIDEFGSECDACGTDHLELADALSRSLAGEGVDLFAVLVVDRVAAGGRWFCADGCGANGVVDDPAASPLAAAAVLDGRRLYRRRAELLDVIAVADADRSARLAEAIAARRIREPSAAQVRETAQLAMLVAARLAGGTEPADAELVALACALSDPRVRDILYALAVGGAAAEAEELWAQMARVLPDRARPDALSLLAFSAYARGDGPLAGIALEAALQLDPRHRMAAMLDSALQSGMRPEQIRGMALSGYRTAEKLGVRLPPRLAFGQRAG